MKKALSILFIILFSPLAIYGFNFATTIRNSQGELLCNQNIKLQISILKESANGDATFIEQFSTTTNPFGVANVVIGNGTNISGDFMTIDWSAALFLKAEVAIHADNNFILINTSQIGAVPFAMHSNTANALTLSSASGTKWDITVDNNGNLLSTPVNSNIEVPEYGTVDYIFDSNALPTITVEVSTNEWNKLLLNFDKNPNNEEAIVADFYFNKYGTISKIENMGLRLRGNTSRVRPEGSTGELHNPTSPNWHHCHFAFRFEKFQDNNLFSGTDRFSLRWAKDDATYVHEIYSYDLLRRFGVWTTPKSSYCRLKIKIKEDNSTAYYGVYEMFEGFDDQYIADRTSDGKFSSTEGFLWKMGWGSNVGAYLTLDQANAALMGIEDVPLEGASSTFTYDYKSKKKRLPEATAQLINFITDLNNRTGDDFVQWAEKNINIDLLLRAYAVTIAVGQWDDYWGNGNNFYLYFDTDGRCHYIPYDFDNALGTSMAGIVDNPGTKDPLNWGSENRPLITKVLAVEKWREQYKAYLKELASPTNDYLDAEKSIARIKKWHEQIINFVKNDTNEDGVIEDKPASWSSGIKNYRLLTGDDEGGKNSDPNFFKTKVKTINNMK